MNRRAFLNHWQAPLFMAGGYLPAALLLGVHGEGNILPQILALCGFYIGAAELCLMISGRKRVAAGIAAAALMIAGAVRFFPIDKPNPTVLIPLMYAGLLLGGLQMGGWDADRELHPGVGITAMAAHLAGQAMTSFGDPLKYAPLRGPLAVSFVIFAVLGMLTMNRESLSAAANGQQGMPRSIRRKNTALTLGMSALVLAIASLPAVLEVLNRLGQMLVRVLKMLLSWLRWLVPMPAGSGGGQGGQLDLSEIEVKKPGLFARILEKIAIGLALVLAAALAFWVLRFLLRRARALLRWMRRRLSEYLAVSSEDYVDEVADTREDGGISQRIRRAHKRAAVRRVDERTLPPSGKIRNRYRLASLKHPEWTPWRTARENLPEGAARLYERARYSGHDVTEEDVRRFSEEIQKDGN